MSALTGWTQKKYLLLLIVAIAAFMRLYALPSLPPGLFSDEAVNGVNTLQVINDGTLKVFYPENFGREGLFINIQAVFVWFFGTEAWALRIPSAFFGIFTVLGIYFLGKELFWKNAYTQSTEQNSYSAYVPAATTIGLLAAFFLATSFWHVNFSRIGFRAIMAPFWSVWGFYFILLGWRFFEENKGKLARMGIALLGGIIFGLGLHSYISYRVMPALLALTAFLCLMYLLRAQRFSSGAFAYWCIVGLGVLIAALPLIFYFVETPADFFGRTSQISVFSSPSLFNDLAGNILKTAGMFNFAGDFNERHNLRYPALPWLAMPELQFLVGLSFLVGIWRGLRNIFHNPLRIFDGGKFAYFFLFAWAILASLPVVISNEGLPHALRAILMLPPVMLFSGLGAATAWRWVSNKLEASSWDGTKNKRIKIDKGIATALLFLIAFEGYVNYFIFWAKSPETKAAFNYDVNELAYELRALPPQLPKYVIVSPGNMGVNIVQFLTDTYTPQDQKTKNFRYLSPEEAATMGEPDGIVVRIP